MSDVLGAGVDVHCFPLLIARSRAAIRAQFGLRSAPESEVETITYLCRRAGCQRAPVGIADCYSLLLTMTANRVRTPRATRKSRALEPRSVRLGQTKIAFGDRALTDTQAAFSLA